MAQCVNGHERILGQLCRACRNAAATRYRRRQGRQPRPSREERFWAKVPKLADDRCWEWAGARFEAGYGRFGDVLAHRLAFELANSPIPAGLSVCHRCDNPPCVNPAHLFLGTHRQNMLDMHAKGRAANYSPPRKITAIQAAAIIEACASGRSQASVAAEFGVAPSLVSQIVRGKVWARQVAELLAG